MREKQKKVWTLRVTHGHEVSSVDDVWEKYEEVEVRRHIGRELIKNNEAGEKER